MRAPSRFAAAVVAVALAASLVACGDDDVSSGSGAGDVPTVEPATPAASPPESGQLPGTVVQTSGGTALAQAGTQVAVLGTDRLLRLLTPPGAADTPAPREVELPGVTAVVEDGDGFLAATPDQIARVGRDGAVTRVAGGQGTVLSLAVAGDQILVGTSDGHLRVLNRSGELQRDIYDFVQVNQILVAPESSDVAGQVIVVDRAQSMVAPVDIATGDRKAALRAGNGAAVATIDSYGRVLLTNTPDDQLLGFFGTPIVMRFRYPVAAAPWAVAWDQNQKLLWVSTTADNQAIGYDLSTGEPRELMRLATVGQVAAMRIDPASGMLYLISQRGDGLQAVPRTLLQPGR